MNVAMLPLLFLWFLLLFFLSSSFALTGGCGFARFCRKRGGRKRKKIYITQSGEGDCAGVVTMCAFTRSLRLLSSQ